ncbi:NMD protein [Culex quinquefasciatus]|uniref:NMD protein n=1 Tax=Culex quinquefasciatus TaxID=7176 RepID=B0X5L1_CULQU|nr:NMD protein [Culex quinquefasciatus]|eukprot:XP_001864933.1 NMD protein [Culex quinquefasciatus]
MNQRLYCECVTCLRTHVDITANIPKQAIVFCGRNWVRYLNPPSEWVQCSLESKELLVDAGFIWTEPHSKRIKRSDVRRLSPDGGEGLLVDFVQAVLPVKVTNAKKLIPHDIHSNSYNYKYSYELHVVPFSKGSIVCLRKKAAEVPVAHLAYHQSGQSDLRFRRISLKESLETIGGHMVEFVVTDMEIDRDNKKKNFPRQGPVSFRNCPNWAHTRAHLGHLLKVGDSVLGYDLAEANNNNGNFEKLKLDAMHKQSRNWKLKHQVGRAGHGPRGGLQRVPTGPRGGSGMRQKVNIF